MSEKGSSDKGGASESDKQDKDKQDEDKKVKDKQDEEKQDKDKQDEDKQAKDKQDEDRKAKDKQDEDKKVKDKQDKDEPEKPAAYSSYNLAGRYEASPVGAQNVSYTTYYTGDGSRSEDPTGEVLLGDIPKGKVDPGCDMSDLRARLFAARVLFVLFEPSQFRQCESLRSQLLHAMGEADYVFRTMGNGKVLDFDWFRTRSSLFRYEHKKRVVFTLPSHAMLGRSDILIRTELSRGLAAQLTELNAYMVVSVSMAGLPSDERDLIAECTGDHIHRIVTEAMAAPQSKPEEPVRIESDIIAKTVQFVATFFPSLTHREFGALVRDLLQRLQLLSMPAADDGKPAAVDFANQWALTQDDVQEKCGIIFVQDGVGEGKYVFADLGRGAGLSQLFLSRSIAWVGRQFDVVMDMLFSDGASSSAFQQDVFNLLMQLQQRQFVAVSDVWLWDLYAANVKAGIVDAGFFQFRSLLHHLLKSERCGDAAVQFLRLLVQRCAEAEREWLDTFQGLDIVRQILSIDELPDDHRAMRVHVFVALDSLHSEQLAPFYALKHMEFIIVDALNVVPAVKLIPIMIDLVRSAPEIHPNAGRFEVLELNLWVKPGLSHLFSLLLGHCTTYYDLLAEFGVAVLDFSPAENEPADPSRDAALTVMLDALHLSIFNLAGAYVDKMDDAFARFLDSACSLAAEGPLSVVLGRTNSVRNLQHGSDEASERLQAGKAAASLYMELALALFVLEEKQPGDLKRRLGLLLQPLLREFNRAQRNELREAFRKIGNYHNWEYLHNGDDVKAASVAKRRLRVSQLLIAAMSYQE